MKHIARAIEQGNKSRPLTDDAYKATLAKAGYRWMIDGKRTELRRGAKVSLLRREEVEALARLIENPGHRFTPKGLFPRAASPGSAQKRFEVLRKRVEPARTKTGSFRTSGRGDDLRYSFEPDAKLRYCLIRPINVQPQYAGGKPPVCPLCGSKAFRRVTEDERTFVECAGHVTKGVIERHPETGEIVRGKLYITPEHPKGLAFARVPCGWRAEVTHLVGQST